MISKQFFNDPAPLPEALLHMLRSGRLPHAVLLLSEQKDELERAGIFLAAGSVCENEENAPCGTCRHCRKAAEGIHPDISVVLPGETGTHKIDSAREIRSSAFTSPNEASRRVFVISEFERMNKNAQNALLKILEEPPRFVVFVLLSKEPDTIETTVLSRVVKFFLISAQHSGGNNLNQSSFAAAFLLESLVGSHYEALKLAEKGAGKKQEATASFQEMADILVFALKLKSGAADFSNKVDEKGTNANANAAEKLARLVTADKLAAALETVEKICGFVAANVSPSAALNYFIADIINR